MLFTVFHTESILKCLCLYSNKTVLITAEKAHMYKLILARYQDEVEGRGKCRKKGSVFAMIYTVLWKACAQLLHKMKVVKSGKWCNKKGTNERWKCAPWSLALTQSRSLIIELASGTRKHIKEKGEKMATSDRHYQWLFKCCRPTRNRLHCCCRCCCSCCCTDVQHSIDRNFSVHSSFSLSQISQIVTTSSTTLKMPSY